MAPNRSVSPVDIAHGLSPTSPQAQAPSKRDKRRTALIDKMNHMVQSFNQNLRPHYEAQLNAMQVDINLIMRADPYQNAPLPDTAHEIDQVIHDLFGGQIPADAVAEPDFLAEAGKLYGKFAIEANNLMEERDVALTMLAVSSRAPPKRLPTRTELLMSLIQQNKHNKTLEELEARHQFHVQLAREEHKQLADTVRQRLFTSLDKRRKGLLAEKEALDIGDSNSSLLHPDQYRHIHNPSSPGGTQNARKTRNARHRVGDPDELPSAAITQENRRKRKAGFDEPDGSPGPTSRNEHSAGSPYRDAKAKREYSQYGAPAFSIERLFTEKELAMHMNTAAIAASNFMVNLKANGNPSATETTNGVNGHHTDTEDAPAAPSIPSIINEPTEPEDDSTPAAGAPEMDRTANTSQYTHATRGATRNALTDLATIAEGRLPFPFPAHSIPTYFPAVMGAKANGAAPTPAPLTQAEIDQDFAIIGRQGVGSDDALNKRLLEHAVGEQGQAENQLQGLGVQQGFVEFRYAPPVTATASEKDALAEGLSGGLLIGGIGMSRQTSMGGGSDAGGAPMSRTASGAGGIGLRRTGSYRGRARAA